MRLLRKFAGSAVLGLSLLAGPAWAANEVFKPEEKSDKPPVLEYIATVLLTAGGMYAICKPSRRQLV